MWRHLDPLALGPIVPFLIQAFFYWVGILLVSVWAQRTGWRYAAAIPLVALPLDVTLSVAYVWKDSATTAVFVLAIGLALMASLQSPRGAVASILVISLLLGFIVSVRWYLFPAIAILWLGLVVFVGVRRTGSRRPGALSLRGAMLSGALFILAALGSNVFVTNHIRPTTERPMS